jgi:hypothetical protein
MTTDTTLPPTAVDAAPWRADQLPPVLHRLHTTDGHRLAVRLIWAGHAYGRTARLASTPLVEVRRWTRGNEADGQPGDVVALWDLTLFLHEPRASWAMFGAGMAHHVPEGDLEDMYATVHAAATGTGR